LDREALEFKRCCVNCQRAIITRLAPLVSSLYEVTASRSWHTKPKFDVPDILIQKPKTDAWVTEYYAEMGGQLATAKVPSFDDLLHISRKSAHSSPGVDFTFACQDNLESQPVGLVEF
jgi:hypothetical protein